MIRRTLEKLVRRSRKSLLLLGPRQTGKSTLVADFIVEKGKDTWAVEVKASKSIGKHDLRGLNRFRDFHGKTCGAVVLYLGTVEKRIEGIEILPWQVGLARMGL